MWMHADLKSFVPADASAVVSRVLRAWIAHARWGYVPSSGLAGLATFASCFMSEEECFWLLTSIAESQRLADFYSPLPAAMNGFQIESQTVGRLFAAVMPNVVAARGHIDLYVSVDKCTPRWLCGAFLDALPLAQQIAVFDGFCAPVTGSGSADGKRGGDAALFRVALAGALAVENRAVDPKSVCNAPAQSPRRSA
jgi:hypothetical protein